MIILLERKVIFILEYLIWIWWYIFKIILKIYIGIKPKNIIIMGRSIGTGPATYLASKREVGLLVLISPFSSIK